MAVKKKKIKTIEDDYKSVLGEEVLATLTPYAFKFETEGKQHSFHFNIMSDKYSMYDGINGVATILFNDPSYIEHCIEVCESMGGTSYKPNLKMPKE